MNYFDGIIDVYDGNSLDLDVAKAIGVKAIFHQTTRGLYKKDVAYAERKKQALERGFLWGAYHLLSSEDVNQQVDYFLSVEDGSDPRIALAIDWEKSKKGLMSLDDVRSFVLRFNAKMKEKGRDFYPILYAGHILRDQKEIVAGDALLAQCPLWYAQYTNGSLKFPVATWSDFTLWQFDDENRKYGAPPPKVLPGADFNSFKGTADQLAAAWPLERPYVPATTLALDALTAAPVATAGSVEKAPSTFAASLAEIAVAEWIRFGGQTMDADGEITKSGHQEYEQDADDPNKDFAAMVGRYWLEGSGTSGIDGTDRDWPWSATFTSWVVKRAGAADRFRYSTQHSVFISMAIRDRVKKRQDASYWAYRLDEKAPEVGDIVCWGREGGVDYDHQQGGDYLGHSDIVVEVFDDHVDIIGGNVGQSVTRRPLLLDEKGRLEPVVVSGENLFALMKNRL